MTGGRPMRAWPMLVVGALVLLGWDAATWWWYVSDGGFVPLPDYLFMMQDMPVLIGLAAGLLAMIPLEGGRSSGRGAARPALPSGWAILVAILVAVIAARVGRDLVFHAYSPSRDELMAEMAGAYLADGHIGWPIPAEWLPYAHAIQPEFTSPYGADRLWTAIYLPVHPAIRAVFVWLGDGDLAAPVTLGVGLLALWDVARRLFPDRADARAVVMVMALTSTQLVATAMTPYAMTSHFALNMLWLALVLRERRWASIAAGLVLVLACGLHQWHFPILFAGPFILWLLWRRRWRAALIQIGALGLGVLVWAKLWPMLLERLLGPPQGGEARGAPDVDEKVASLFGRLSRWQPLLNLARLTAWNNALLLPLSALALGRLPRSVAGWLREPPIVLPLFGLMIVGIGTALYQGYGWGFRYMHGSLGGLCLLAGYGWTVLAPDGRRSLRIVWLASIVSLVAAGWLLVTTERHVRPYARTLAAMQASDADVVLVDLRGGYFMTDLVRFREGRPVKPAIMALAQMTDEQLRNLCARHKVALMDHAQFWALGVHPVSPVIAGGERLDTLRRTLDQLHCGRPVVVDVPNSD